MSQIFTGQIRACRLFHYLPVSRPVICSVFLSISVSLRLSLSLSLFLSRILTRSVKSWLREKRDEKKTKWLLIQRPCVTALSESITLITPTGKKNKKSAAGHQSRISRPFTVQTVNAQAQSMGRVAGWESSRIDTTFLPRTFFILFSLLVIFLSWCFLQPAGQSHLNSAGGVFS